MAWLFLTVGLTLGALWAYEELGWGGYWGWDPVENAGLLPWFTATAFLHSVMVQERRGMLKIWNVSLVIVTFFLTIFGTFMTRSGVVQSVHAFGQDTQLAYMFTGFMVLTLIVSFGLVIWRMPLLRSRNELDSWASREAAFMANNWVLLFAAFFTLFATMFPTLSEAVTGERLTVGAPFFDKWLTPVGLALLFLTGVGPLLAWRKSTIVNLVEQFLLPLVGAGVTLAATSFALGIAVWPAGVCFALCAFVVVSIGQEFVRGASVRRRATGTDVFTALVGLFARSRRRYGGYIVHVGIVLAFIGFAGNGFERNETVLLKPGEQFALAPYTVRYVKLSITKDPGKQMVTADLNVTKNGKPFAEMFPARWFYVGHEDEPTTEVALRRQAGEDLYLVLAGYDAGQQSASFLVRINPLVNWIWFGVGVMIMGTIVAFIPERAMAFATSRVPDRAVTTSLVVLLAVALGGMTLSAQGKPGMDMAVAPTARAVPRTALEKDLDASLVCMCGTCEREAIGECQCSTAADMRGEVADLVAQGKTREEIIQYFIQKYGGQQVLAAPIDKGFNRLAWAVPYGAGLLGIGLVGGIAVRWSRRREGEAPVPTAAPNRPDLEDRLDDELRELD